MKFKYIVLTASLLTTTLLYLLTTLTQPPTITLQDAPHYDGQTITTTGTITTIHTTTNQATQLTLTDPTTTATLLLYTTQPTTLTYGDTIQATGTIQHYQNTWELDATTLTLINHNITTLTPLRQLATDPHHYQDTTITTTGIVTTTTQTTFTLKDPDSPTTIIVHGATTQPTKGTHILLHASLLYDPDTFRYTLQLTNATAYTIQP